MSEKLFSEFDLSKHIVVKGCEHAKTVRFGYDSECPVILKYEICDQCQSIYVVNEIEKKLIFN